MYILGTLYAAVQVKTKEAGNIINSYNIAPTHWIWPRHSTNLACHDVGDLTASSCNSSKNSPCKSRQKSLCMDVTNIHGCHSSLTALQPSTIFPPFFLSRLKDDDSGDESVILPGRFHITKSSTLVEDEFARR